MSAIDTMASDETRSVGGARAFLRRVTRALVAYHLHRRELSRTRIRLFELSDGELRDIGLTRELADREAARSLLACYMNKFR